MTRKIILFAVVFIGISFQGLTQEKQLAFPGAEGFGAYAVGGRGGDVYIVTNLNDSGEGSLREAVEAKGARTVVFSVSGTIELESSLRVGGDSLTIAGQTAPGDGICIKNYPLVIYESNHVIVRYIRSRLGIDRRFEHDALMGRFCNNVIIDHCSFSWSVDETVGPYDVSNYTLQWCVISESLENSIHPEGSHGMGAFIGGKGFSFHHNLLAHHHNRLPRFCGSRYSGKPELEKVDFRNNVLYNWEINNSYGGEGGSYNIVNNYYKYGPATNSSRRNRIVAPREDDGGEGIQPAGTWGRFHVYGNYVYGYPEITANNWNGGVQEVTEEEVALIKEDDPFDMANVNTQSPIEAYYSVLQHAGASYPKRDRVDARVTEETREGIAKYGNNGIIDHPSDVGGYPKLMSKQAPKDSDKDGIPDEWEDANGLDKNDSEDGKSISEGGYSNLELYINGLIESYIPMERPGNLKVEQTDTMKVELIWTDKSETEEYYIVERSYEQNTFEQIAKLNANDTTYLDISINEFGTYTYRVKAINSETESAYTDPVKANIEDPTVAQYQLIINNTGNGEVLADPTEVIYDDGTSVTLTAIPEEGWSFFSWGGDISGKENPRSLIIDEEKKITANFIQITSDISEPSFEKLNNIRIYPLPFKDEINVTFNLKEEQSISISVINLAGVRLFFRPYHYFPSGINTVTINGGEFPEGAYILSIKANNSIYHKIVVRS